MGIPGIYKEIGTGERIALSKLAVQHLENTGRPFRLAIDISIWQFQIQSGQGGKNPALRTLYYRLLRLLGLSLQPLFVFDGPHRPSFKRGVNIAKYTASLDNFVIKQLLKCFGFPFHDAPGEAEAECALLQKEGIVDAVLSEDVDTMMFGCSLSLRNWTAEGSRGNKSPTHVDVHRAAKTKETSGLDSEGMILVALMSGGDYVQAGVPGCGIKTACQAARAGFGRELCQLLKDDVEGFREWRQRLEHEIRTNESRFFTKKLKTMTIPETFPNKKVFGYYTHPVISCPVKICSLGKSIKWNTEIKVADLRTFVAEAFSWTYLIGAKHFIRGLAPVLLAKRLVSRGHSFAADRESMDSKTLAETNLVKAVSERRNHWVTDGEPELRIAYIPADIIDLDLNAEDVGLVESADSEGDGEEGAGPGEELRQRSKSPTKRPSAYNPTQIEKIWILETFVKLGAPLLVETWEEDMRNPKKFASRKAREKRDVAKARKQYGTMERFVKISKPGIDRPDKKAGYEPREGLVPITANYPGSPQKRAVEEKRRQLGEKPPAQRSRRTDLSEIAPRLRTSEKNKQNPWTLARECVVLENHFPNTASVVEVCSAHGDEPAEKPLPACSNDFVTQRSNRRCRHKHACSRSETSADDVSFSAEAADENIAPEALSTPKESDGAKPSPREERSPLQLANDLYVAGQPMTPRSIAKDKEHAERFIDLEKDKTENRRRFNRGLDFIVAPRPPAPSSVYSDKESLPSASTPLSPAASQPAADLLGGSITATDKRTGRTIARSLIAIRESLEGTWKNIEPSEVKSLGVARRVYNSVEVLDLTGG